jgi:peptidoglycan/LPS O-acetylase OafA/YrhL
MIKLSAWMAIGAGLLLGAGQIARNYDNLANWPTWTIDLVAAAVMVVAGVLALRRRTTRLLPVGWSFALGLYTSSFVTHWNVTQGASGELLMAEERLVMIIGALVAICLAGIALVLLAPKTSDHA